MDKTGATSVDCLHCLLVAQHDPSIGIDVDLADRTIRFMVQRRQVHVKTPNPSLIEFNKHTVICHDHVANMIDQPTVGPSLGYLFFDPGRNHDVDLAAFWQVDASSKLDLPIV
jgi:hypothetical protein